MVSLSRTADADKRQEQPSGLIDGCGRRIDHLRLSVTSRCELRCVYCRPKDASFQAASCDLSDRQRVELVRFLRERFGLTQVRITGGEPLLYPNIVSLVAELKRTVPDVVLAMTTNGRLLYQKGVELYEAGLDRLNVSLDSLDPVRYRRITGASIEPLLEGLESARFVGFAPPKINTVVLRGLNDGEIHELARWAWSRGSEIRFLEAMPIGPAAEANRRAYVSGAEIKAKLAEWFDLEPIARRPGETAKRFRASGKSESGIVGLITPVSEPFCADCRRMRLTATGRLFPCLLDERSVDLNTVWSMGTFDDTEAHDVFCKAVGRKKPRGSEQPVSMIALGG